MLESPGKFEIRQKDNGCLGLVAEHQVIRKASLFVTIQPLRAQQPFSFQNWRMSRSGSHRKEKALSGTICMLPHPQGE